MASKVNVTEIISKHRSTLQNEEGNLLKKDRKLFLVYPFVIGVIMVLIVGIPNEGLINIFAICLSIFIGLFLNLLVLIISFAETKLKIKDKNNRAKLLEQTFYNITYTIVVSLIGLGVLFLANVEFLPDDWLVNLNKILAYVDFTIKPFKVNIVISVFLFFLFYVVFTHIIMTLLMIIKRIFKLFKIEIDEMNKNIHSKPTSTGT